MIQREWKFGKRVGGAELMGLKQYVNQRIIKHSSYTTAFVQSIDKNGLMELKIKGQDELLKMYNNTGINLIGGETVNLCRIEGGDQGLSITSFGAFNSPAGHTVINI